MKNSNDVNQEATTETAEIEAPVVVVRDANLAIGELKVKAARLSRQEAKAVESDKLAATFNEEIMEMATGAKAQTPDRSIATISAEQVKHIKRAANTRKNNTDLASEIRATQAEIAGFLEELLLPYPVAVVADEVEEDGVETDEHDVAENDED